MSPNVLDAPLAHFESAALLTLELATTTQELFRHYRELVIPDEAAKYWGSGPATQTTMVEISA